MDELENRFEIVGELYSASVRQLIRSFKNRSNDGFEIRKIADTRFPAERLRDSEIENDERSKKIRDEFESVFRILIAVALEIRRLVTLDSIRLSGENVRHVRLPTLSRRRVGCPPSVRVSTITFVNKTQIRPNYESRTR